MYAFGLACTSRQLSEQGGGQQNNRSAPKSCCKSCWAGLFLPTSRNPNYDKIWLWALLCSRELSCPLQAGTSSLCCATLFCLVSSGKRIQIFVFVVIFFKCTSHRELENGAGQLANSIISFFLESEEEGSKSAKPHLTSLAGAVQGKRENLPLEEGNLSSFKTCEKLHYVILVVMIIKGKCGRV